jgi:putative ABC transport system ATP-binding protein
MSHPTPSLLPDPPEPDPSPAVAAVDLSMVYGEGDTRVVALDGVTVSFESGRFSAIMGPSGSGKSTLLHCLAGLDTPTSGSVSIAGTPLVGMSDDDLTRFRRDHVGFVFQAFNLLPMLPARDNITVAMDIAGQRPDPEWLDVVIDALGIRDRLDHLPAQLSGGQQQRVACARALASRPAVVFADEPTGNLDSRAGAEVLDILAASTRELERTVVMVTHDPAAAARADRVVFLGDGRVRDELREPTVRDVIDAMAGLETPGSRS